MKAILSVSLTLIGVIFMVAQPVSTIDIVRVDAVNEK